MTWATLSTPERVAAVKAHIAAHPTDKETEIAEALGATRETIRHCIRYHGIERAPRRKGDTTIWTEEHVAALQRMWGDGASAKQIAIRLANGATRDSVIGKLDRLGLLKTRAPKPTRPAHGLIFGKPSSPVPTLPKDVKPGAFDPLPGAPAPVKLHELGQHQCHWPVGEGFCGCHAKTSRYCPTHTKMSGKMVPRLVFA